MSSENEVCHHPSELRIWDNNLSFFYCWFLYCFLTDYFFLIYCLGLSDIYKPCGGFRTKLTFVVQFWGWRFSQVSNNVSRFLLSIVKWSKNSVNNDVCKTNISIWWPFHTLFSKFYDIWWIAFYIPRKVTTRIIKFYKNGLISISMEFWV